MKTILTTLSLALLTGAALADTEPLSTVVEQGLFEEEVNRDFDAAIAAYETAVDQFDQTRRLAATAIFRLAENYRRAGRTGEAEALFERVVREFHDHTELAEAAATRLPDDHLAALGAGAADTPADEEAQEIARLKEVLQNSPDQFYSHSGIGGESLLQAIQNEQMRVVEFIVDQGFDIASPWRRQSSRQDPSAGDSPLYTAVSVRNLPAVEFLVNEGVDVNEKSRDQTPLHTAALRGFLAGAEVLLEDSADVNARASRGQTPLYFASGMNFTQLSQLLLDYGADVNTADVNSRTPLYRAVEEMHLRMVELLLDHGADVNTRTESYQLTPLQAACEGGATWIWSDSF